jgi:hypothetical protein
MIIKLKLDIKMFNFTLTNPADDMLLGFSKQEAVSYNEDGDIIGTLDIFSIGLFICRIDIFFNNTMEE